MTHWSTWRAPRGEKEKVDMRVDLRHNGVVDVEMDVQGLERYVGPQAAVLPLIAERVGGECTIRKFSHEHDGVQYTGNSCRCEDR